MSNTIKIKRGSGSDPGASDLVVGELAVRTDNGKLFTKKDDNSITQLSGGGIDDGDKGDITVSNSGQTFTIDNGVVTGNKIADDTIVNVKIDSAAAIAGTKISPDFGSQNITTTGNLTVGGAIQQSGEQVTIENSGSPTLMLNDTSGGAVDYKLRNVGGDFKIVEGSSDRLVVNADGHIDIAGNVDFGAGIDVTGNITSTGDLTITNSSPKIVFNDAQQNPDFHINNNNGIFEIVDTTNSQTIAKFENAKVTFVRNVDADAGLDVTGNITVSGTVDGRDVAADGTKLDGIESNATANQTNEEIQDIVGGMLTGNTETGITVTYQDGDGTIDFVVGTLNQDTTGNAATATALETARTIAGVSFDGSANISLNNNAITNGAGYLTSVGTSNITNDAVTFDKIENIAQNSFLARLSSGSGSVEELSASQVRGILNVENGATADQSASEIVALVADQTIAPGTIDMEDDEKIKLGASDDLEIYHNGSNSIINDNGTGNLQLQVGGSTKFNTQSGGVQFYGSLYADDSNKIELGNDQDLKIYHDGSDSFVKATGTGSLKLQCDVSNEHVQVLAPANGDFRAYVNNGTLALICNASGQNVEMRHGGNKKAETVSGGFTVTGTCTATAFSGDGSNLTNLPSSSDSTKLPLSGGELTGDLITHQVRPDGNGNRELGTSSFRWQNIYTSDLDLSNEGSSNDVDGTWGSYTIQEGADDLFLLNKRNGKKYKFNLTEVN